MSFSTSLIKKESYQLEFIDFNEQEYNESTRLQKTTKKPFLGINSYYQDVYDIILSVSREFFNKIPAKMISKIVLDIVIITTPIAVIPFAIGLSHWSYTARG